MTLNHMGRMARAALLTVIFAGPATSMTFGQSSSQGAIAGTAEDATGAVIPKVAVTITNDGTNSTLNLMADDSGYFKAPLVEPGTYTVTISASGFGAFEQKVVVSVGKLTEVMPRMATGAAATTVQVTADQPLMNFESPDVSASLDRAAIDNIPVQNRRWSALALTTPGVVADSSGFGLVSVRGMSTLFNTVLIDGADDNQDYYSEERGRTREAYSTSENAVSEFEVNTGVYAAQYGRSAGGVINSVTRSGTNNLHGELFFNDLDRGFGAYDPGSTNPQGLPLKPKDLRKIYGGSVGGHLIRDKLFWFYTYDQQSHINPAISKAKSYGSATTVGSFLDQPTATPPGTCSVTTGYLTGSLTATPVDPNYALDSLVCSMAARLSLPTYAAAATYYDNGLAALQTDLGLVQRVGFQEINTPKLDYQINGKERVSFLFHRLRWDAPGDVQTSTSAIYSKDAFGTDFVKLDYGLAKLDSQISSHLTNELLYQYSRELDDEGQQPYTPYTLANLVAPNGPAIVGSSNGPGGTIPYIALATSVGFNLGSPYYSYSQAKPAERKWQVGDILYYTVGNHSFRFGGDVLRNTDSIHQEPYYYGDYTYGSVANYLTDLATKGNVFGGGATGTCNATGAAGTATATTVGTYGCYSGVYQDFGATAFSIVTTDIGGFVQDNWKISPRLTLELGVRYDVEMLPSPSANLIAPATGFVPYASLANSPQDHNNIGPRIGFAMDIFGNGQTVLRGGYGLYYGRIVNASLLTALFGTGSPVSQYSTATMKPTAAGTPQFPNPLAGGSSSKPGSIFLAPNLQAPQVDEFTLAVQQQLGRGSVLSVTYLGGYGRTLPNFLNVNLAPPQDTATVQVAQVTTGSQGPLAANSVFSVPVFGTCTASATCPYPTGYINPNFTNIVEYLSNINSNYNSLTFDISNRSFHRVQFDANYTWSHALDFNQNATATLTSSTNNWLNPYASQRQNYGVSQFNVGNRVVGYVVYNFPGIRGGNPLSYLINGWSINDTFQMQNGLPYDANLASGTGGVSTLALNNATYNGINGVTYLAPIGLNTYQVPRAIVDDLRLQKEFVVHEKYTLQLNADMYNVANHQNFSISDVNTSAYSLTGTTAAGSTLTYLPNTAPGIGFGSHSTSNDSGFLYTPREFQIQARLEF